jgi:fibronectin-binding autotransporter adhesin
MADNGTFDVSNATAGVTVANLSGSGAVSLGANSLTLASASGAFSGAIGGTGGLTVGGGTATLSGANTYTGATTINAGATLALSGGGSIASSSSVTDNGTFDVSNATAGVTVASLSGSGAVSLGANSLTLTSASGAFSGAIGGIGGLTVGGGTETLSGANTYTGATTINTGATLALAGGGSIASSSGVADNGTFDVSNATAGVTVANLSGSGAVSLGANSLTLASASGAFSGAIGGTGGLTVGGGTETLSGANTYTGATTINTGATLALVGGGSIASSSGVTDNGTFDVSNATAGVAVAGLSGSGAVSLGANTLSVGSSGASTTFAGSISGSGGLTKVGAGELSLTGDSTYAGATLVQAGILSVNGSIANSAVTVASGGTLSGVGRVGSLTVNGVVTPGGGSIGTLTVNGNLSLGSGSVYQAEINQAGQSDLIAVSGSAHLGGTLQINAAPGAYVRATTYEVVSASSITGTFSAVTGNLPFVDPTLVNAGNRVDLLWQSNGVAFQSLAVTPNQRAAATAINLAPSSPLYTAISTQTTAGARQAFDAISGEVYADAPAELVQESHLVRDALLERLRDGASSAAASSYGGASDVTVWVQGIGDFARSSAEGGGNIASTQADTGGAILGVDAKLPVANSWRVGVATAYTDTTLNDDGRGSHQTIDATHISGYAGGAVIGDLQARLGFDYAWTRLDTHRQVAFPGVNETDKASPDAQVADLFVETGYVFRFGRLRVEPFASGAYVHANVQAAQETGGIATLNLGKDALDATLSEAGVRMSGSWRLTPMAVFQPYLTLSERHAFGNEGSSALLSFTGGGPSFLTRGVGLDRDAGNVEFGGVFDLGDRIQVDAGYSSQLSSHWQDETLKLTASYRF